MTKIQGILLNGDFIVTSLHVTNMLLNLKCVDIITLMGSILKMDDVISFNIHTYIINLRYTCRHRAGESSKQCYFALDAFTVISVTMASMVLIFGFLLG